MNGEKWFQDFLNRMLANRSFRKTLSSSVNQRRQTNLVLGFIGTWVKDDGYNVKLAPDTPIGIDLKWSWGNDLYLALEHENVGNVVSKLKPEVRRLLDIDGKLKVLITYVSNSRFPEKVDEYLKIFRSELATSSQFSSEFLFIAAPWDITHPSEYVGFRFYPGFREAVVLPRYHKYST